MDGKNQLNRIKWLMDQMQQEAGHNLTDFARPATAGQVYALAGAVRGLAQAVLANIETEPSDSEPPENGGSNIFAAEKVPGVVALQSDRERTE